MKFVTGINRSRIWENIPEIGTNTAHKAEKSMISGWQGYCLCNTMMDRIAQIVSGRFLLIIATFLFGVALNGVRAEELHLGGKNLPGKGKSVVNAPLYLTNFNEITINQLEFDLKFDEAYLEFNGFEIDTALVVGWEVDTIIKQTGSVKVALNTDLGINSSWFKSGVAKFTIRGNPGDVQTDLTFDNVEVNQNSSLATQNTPFAIDFSRNDSENGDVNLDGVVDIQDARKLFNLVTSGEPVRSEYDLDGDFLVGAMDVSLLYRHAIGLLPDFDNIMQPSQKQVTLNLDQLEPLGQGLYRYELTGQGLEGLSAIEFSFDVPPENGNPSIVSAFGFGSDAGLSHVQYLQGNYEETRMLVYFASPEKMTSSENLVFTIIVSFNSFPNLSGTQLYSAHLNGGQFKDIQLKEQFLYEVKRDMLEQPSVTTYMGRDKSMDWNYPEVLFNSEVPDHAYLRILNADGGFVSELKLTQGTKRIRLDNLQPGRYFVIMLAPNRKQILGKILIQK